MWATGEIQRVSLLSRVQREVSRGAEEWAGKGTEGLWYASWSCPGRDGRYGETDEQEMGVLWKTGPKHSAPHQIQDSVLDGGEEE